MLHRVWAGDIRAARRAGQRRATAPIAAPMPASPGWGGDDHGLVVVLGRAIDGDGESSCSDVSGFANVATEVDWADQMVELVAARPQLQGEVIPRPNDRQ